MQTQRRGNIERLPGSESTDKVTQTDTHLRETPRGSVKTTHRGQGIATHQQKYALRLARQTGLVRTAGRGKAALEAPSRAHAVR